jgi:hypothetical protein
MYHKIHTPITRLIAVISPVLAAICLYSTPCLAEPPDESIAQPKPTAPWSVVGMWYGANAAWDHALIISADGTFTFAGRDSISGHWSLTGMDGHVMLVLDWLRWGTDALIMTGPDDFSRKPHESHFTLHRMQNPVEEQR